MNTYNQLDGHCSHQTTKHDDSDCFNTGSANRILVHTWPSCHAGRDEHDDRRHQVHEGVCGGCKQRQRTGGYGSIELDNEEAKVDDKGGVDGEAHLGAILEMVEGSQALLVAALEKLVNEGVLAIVKLLHVPRLGQGIVGLHLLLRHIIPAVSSQIEGIAADSNGDIVLSALRVGAVLGWQLSDSIRGMLGCDSGLFMDITEWCECLLSTLALGWAVRRS